VGSRCIFGAKIMTKLEVQELLDAIVKEMCPDLHMQFLSKAFIEDDLMSSSIHIASWVNMGMREVVHNDVFDEAKARYILGVLIRESLWGLKNLIQDSLDNLEGK